MNACARCGSSMVCHKRTNRAWQHRHAGRGLCGRCWTVLGPDGRLDYSPRSRRRDDVMAEWDWLRREGVTRQDAPARLGMSVAAFERAYLRARAAGDPRAVPGVAA